MGSRLRWLTEIVTRDAENIYRLYGLDINPKWFPVLYMLYYGTDNTITGIAKSIGQTHPSVSNIVKEMKESGIVSDTKGNNDRRATTVELTPKGAEIKPILRHVCRDVEAVAKSIEADATHHLWEAINNWESKLNEKSLLARVAEEKQHSSEQNVEIVDYRPEHLMTFKRLNIQWINTHWSLEAHDLEVLNHPDTFILNRGGHILIAIAGNQPAGVVALCPMENSDYDYEIAKLAVDPAMRGLGIGEAIFSAAIERARKLGAKKLFLESNTLLKPAISLYRKFGFTELKDYHPAYERGDIQMELTL